jgi:hypothetical protein
MQNNQETSMIPFDFSRDYVLAREVEGLETTIVEAARNTAFEFARNQGVSLTDTEMEAVVTVQVLKELNSVDLASLLLRYKYLRKIRDGNLVTRHPGQYTSLDEIAHEAGISTAELSRIVDLVEVVFPYLGNNLQMDIPTIWKEVGKSNFFDMLPVLKVLITGEHAAHSGHANESAARFLNDAAAGYRAAGQEMPDDEELREGVVRDILEHGISLNNRELRTHLRPEHTSPISTYLFMDRNGLGYALMPVNSEQLSMLARRAGDGIDILAIHPEEFLTAVNIPSIHGFINLLGHE